MIPSTTVLEWQFRVSPGSSVLVAPQGSGGRQQMTPDIRYFLQIVEETDKGDETIYVNTERLIGKAKRTGGFTVWNDNIVLPRVYINTTWFFCNNYQINGKRTTVSQRLTSLTDRSELVVRGHGDVKNNMVSQVSAEVFARALVELGFAVNCRINITGCNLGRDSNVAGAERRDKSASEVGAKSFAAIFQKELWNKKKLTNVVHARTSPVTVTEDGSKETFDFDTEDNPIHKQAHSKIIFTIDTNGVQSMKFAY
jgi:hypothetical protein